MNRPLLSRILLTSLLMLILAAPSAWAEENGAIIDPHGGSTHWQNENGAILDPNGGCARRQEKNGAIIDPHGGCAGGHNAYSIKPASDNGAIIDPSGRGAARPMAS